MPHACVLTSASKAGTTGGTFGDTLVANAGDALAVANYGDGGARWLEAWGIDSTSVAELSIIYTRPQSTHDQQFGFRAAIQSLVPGGANAVAAQDFLPGALTIDVYKSDAATIKATTTAADNVLMSFVIEYDDLPGAAGVFCSWNQVQNLQLSAVGINSLAQASATRGAYGAQRAFNADDPRLHANTWYALLGYTARTPVTTVSLLGPDWGGQRIGGPGSVLEFHTAGYFVDQAVKWGKPLIPCFNSNNAGNILVQVADGAASTTPNLDFILYELSQPPTPGQ